MKEKENLSENKIENNEMIDSNIFDDLFMDNLSSENNDFKDEAEMEDSLFTGEILKEEENPSTESLEIEYGVGEVSEKNDSKLTIGDVFETSIEESENLPKEKQTLTIEDVFGTNETLKKETEETISNIQQQLPSITIQEENADEEPIILKPIVSIQEQLPPITIANEDQINTPVESNSFESFHSSSFSSTSNSIFENTASHENTAIDTNIQIGIEDKEKEETEIDYFNYEFKDDSKEDNTNQPTGEQDQFSFDFYNTIRPQENNQETEISEKVEFSKVFAPKDSSENNDQIITINEESGNEFRREKRKNDYYLYVFYAFLVIFAIGLVFFLIQRKKDFSLTREEITLALRSTYQAEIVANAKIQENTDYEWASSNKDIATVDQNGVISANNKGSATITVTSKKSKKKKKLIVTTVDIIINSIRFDKHSITMTEGDELTLSPIINEDKTIIMNLEWASWNENVVSVDQNGHLIANGHGETSISVTDPTSNVGTEITIIVKAKKASNVVSTNTNVDTNKPISVGKVSLDRANANMKIGDTITVKATVSPSNATNKKISWSSSNPKVATVKNGQITAIAEGKATITVTTQDGNKKASITVTVSKPTPAKVSVQKVTLTSTSITMKVGESKTIGVVITPNNASNKHVSWDIQTNDTIKITQTTDNHITFTGTKAGEAIITVITDDGKYGATCKIKIENPDSSTNSNDNSNSNPNSSSNENSSSNDNNNSNDNPTPDPTPKED